MIRKPYDYSMNLESWDEVNYGTYNTTPISIY